MVANGFNYNKNETDLYNNINEGNMDIQKARSLIEDLEFLVQKEIEKIEEKTGVIISDIQINRIDTRTFDEKTQRHKSFINTIKITTEL